MGRFWFAGEEMGVMGVGLFVLWDVGRSMRMLCMLLAFEVCM